MARRQQRDYKSWGMTKTDSRRYYSLLSKVLLLV